MANANLDISKPDMRKSLQEQPNYRHCLISMTKNVTRLVVKRIALSKEALEYLETEVKRIKEKGPHFKLNESMLASAIIGLFFSKYSKKECERIEANFFDKKVYLKMLIEKSTSEDDLSKSLDEFFHKPNVKKMKQSASKGETNE